MMAAAGNAWTFLSTIPWWTWIPLIVIVGGIIRSIIVMNHKHRERMEMIKAGMDPRDFKK